MTYEDKRILVHGITKNYEDGILFAQIFHEALGDSEKLERVFGSTKLIYKDKDGFDKVFKWRYIPEKDILVPWDGIIAVGEYEIEFDSTFYKNELKIVVTSENKNSLKEIGKFLEDIENSLYELSNSEAKVESLHGEPIKISEMHWNDIGGLEKQKDELTQYVEWPLRNPQVYKAVGINPPKGILLYGPPGTGKTLLAKVVASESDAHFISATPAEITSMWYGQEEKRIHELFEKASEHSPCIIHMDDIDGFFPKGRTSDSHEATQRALIQLVNEMDGLRELKGITVLAATNLNPEDLDPALMREGRFDKKIYIPLPDEDGRHNIFRIYTKRMPLSENVELRDLVKKTEGFSGAKIKEVCERAGLKAIKNYSEQNRISIEKMNSEISKKIRISQNNFYDAIEELLFKENEI